jgi:hypothetical protein
VTRSPTPADSDNAGPGNYGVSEVVPNLSAMTTDVPADPQWAPMSGNDYSLRMAHAQAVHKAFDHTMSLSEGAIDAEARTWFDSTNPTAFVGSRHHVVPRFILERWANNRDQVRVFRRIENRLDTCNIRDLAIKDFYTVIDKQGRKDSRMESLLGVVEGATKPIIDDLLSAWSSSPITGEDVARLAQFASFQATRTPRRRREIELHAEWYYKTMARGHVPEEELRDITIAPHQNELIELTSKSAENLLPFFACRPLALMRLDVPRLYICDEPVVLNSPAGAFHIDDCYLTDEDVERRMEKWLRKTKKGKRGRHPPPGRIVHFASTAPSGFGVADEILLPVSPSAALLWGPLEDRPPMRAIERIKLTGAEADRFAHMANEAMSAQALDWVVGRAADTTFDDYAFPPAGPLMRVCDGTNAASLAVNQPPARFRPARLWTPTADELAAAAADAAG